MRKFLLIMIMCGYSFASGAAEVGPSVRIAANDIMRGQFVQEHYMTGMKKPLRSEGHFVVAPEHGLIWAIEKPFPMNIVVTRDGLSQSIGGVPLIRKPTANMPFLGRVTDLISNALGGNWKVLEKDFTVKKSGDTKNWKAKLTPKDLENIKMPFRSLSAKGGRFVDSADIIRPDGGLETVSFANQSVSNEPPTASEIKAFASVNVPAN